MTAQPGLALGIDLGATKIAAALVAPDGRLLAADQVPTDTMEGAEAVIRRIANLANNLIRQAPGEVVGIGIGSPGQVDSRRGIVRNAVNLGWAEVALADELHSQLEIKLPIYIQIDSHSSALGEYCFGAGQGCGDFIYLGVGSGLGGGVFSGGRLVTGVAGSAAYLGHLSLDPAGALCACGGRGCAETIISGPGLLALARQRMSENRVPTMLSAMPGLTAEGILLAAEAGDALALAVLNEVGRCLGMVMAACVAVLNPARIIIGGGLGLAAFQWLAPAARLELEKRTLAESRQGLTIVPSQVDSSAVGAACLVWYLAKEHPYRDEEVFINQNSR